MRAFFNSLHLGVATCGSDEHGVPITIKAKKEGITPQDVVDRYNAMMKGAFEEFGISFDHYKIQEPVHTIGVHVPMASRNSGVNTTRKCYLPKRRNG